MGDPITTGRVLGGRYRLIRELARGGMGTVWVAEDPLLARTVAVKVLDPALATDDAVRQRFRREAIAAAAVAHPNIVTTYDTGDDGGTAYIVMELVEGRTLREVIDEMGPLPIPMACDIAIQIADALAAAHGRGVVHRDVKPGNVLVQTDGRVKVADFGIAKATDEAGDLTRAGMVIGTARYLAPEQVDGSPVDDRADVYALGLVLYEMLVGQAPFEADTDVASALARLTGGPPPLAQARPGVPPGLARLVDQALARNPDDRLPSAAALRDALTAIRDGTQRLGAEPTRPIGLARTTTVPTTPGAPARTSRSRPAGPPRARVRAGRAVLWVLALALGIGGGFLAVRALQDRPARAGPPSPPPAGPIGPTAVIDFDPEGDDRQEDRANVGAVVDDDPTTVWSTARYIGSRRFGNTKRGVGLVFDLPRGARIRAVEVTATESGWAGAVHASDRRAETLDGWGAPLAAGTDLPAVATFRLEPPTTAPHLLVWFTELPPSLRLQVSGVRFLGTR